MRHLITKQIIRCNKCRKTSEEGAEFNEYPEGEYNWRGDSVDLCDTCVEAGWFISRLQVGVVRIYNANEAEVS